MCLSQSWAWISNDICCGIGLQLVSLVYHIDGVMVSVLATSVVDRGFEPRSGQTKDYTIGICCFSPKHAALKSKSKDWLAQNQYNVSKWDDNLTLCPVHKYIIVYSMIIFIKVYFHSKITNYL